MSEPMNVFPFQPATRPARWARVALIGPPGTGKTYTALTLARGFGGPVGLVDTNGGAALSYAHVHEFATLTVNSYHPGELARLCAYAAEQGILNLIVDTWSPYWSGQDGMLEQVNRRAADNPRTGTSQAWTEMRPAEHLMLGALAGYPGNVILTVRSKAERLHERDEATGKVGSVQVGYKPDQRDGFEEDTDVACWMSGAGTLTVTKTRLAALAGQVIHQPDETLSEQIVALLEEGACGDHFDAVTLRDWANHPDRTATELQAEGHRLNSLGYAGAMVLTEGNAEPLIQLIRRRFREVQQTASPLAAVA